MTEESEYAALKRSIDEWRSTRGHLPSVARVLAAAEKTLARLPHPVTGYVVAWVERHRDEPPRMMFSGVAGTREEAERFRNDVVRWTTSDIKIIEVTIDYKPPRNRNPLEQSS